MQKGFGLIKIIMIVGVLVVVVGGGYYYNFRLNLNSDEIVKEDKGYDIFFFDKNTTNLDNDTRSWTEIQGSKIPVAVNGSELIYKPGGFGLVIPPSWEKIDTEKISFPDNLGNDVKFAYKKKDSGCIFAYVRNPDTSWDEYEQTSFATRLFTTEDEQLDASWYKKTNDLPDGFEFRWEGRQSLPGEVRINPYRYSLPSDSINFFQKPNCVDCFNAFILFSNDGGNVSDSCDLEFSSMLKSIFDKFEYTSIDQNSNGILYIPFGFNTDNSKTFLSVLDNHPFIRVVKDVDIYFDNNPIIHDSKFYYSNEESIYKLDFISGKTRLILSLNPDDNIKDFYFYENKIFVLSNLCETGKGNNGSGCVQKLYEYDSLNKEINLLNQKLPPVSWFKPLRIIGFDSEKNILLLYYSAGDAGCSAQGVYWFDFSSKEFVEGESAGHCEGDDVSKNIEFEKIYKTYQSFLDNFMFVNYIEIHNGQILFSGEYSTDLSPGVTLKYQK